MEIENNSKISFLDRSVYREPDGRLTISVYRKPIHTDQYLGYDLHHPQAIRPCLYVELNSDEFNSNSIRLLVDINCRLI